MLTILEVTGYSSKYNFKINYPDYSPLAGSDVFMIHRVVGTSTRVTMWGIVNYFVTEIMAWWVTCY